MVMLVLLLNVHDDNFVEDSYEQENITTMSQVLSAGAMMVTPDSRYSLVNRNCTIS